MEQAKGWLDALPQIIKAGGENSLTLILAVLILLAALGAYFFRADKAVYRFGVFLILTLLVTLICVRILFQVIPSHEPSARKAGEASASARPESIEAAPVPMPPPSLADPAPAPTLPQEPEPEQRIRWANINPDIYGSNIRLGMTEEELRDELNSHDDKIVVEIGETLGLDHDKNVEALDASKDFEEFDGDARLRLFIAEDIVIGATASFACTGQEDHCKNQCENAKLLVRKAFGEGTSYPAWGPSETEGVIVKREARKSLKGVYFAFAVELSVGEEFIEALIEEGNDYICFRSAGVWDWYWLHNG